MKFLKLVSVVYFSLALLSCANENTENKKSENDSTKDTIQNDSVVVEKNSFKLGEAAKLVIVSNKYTETIKFYQKLGWTIRDSGEQPKNWTDMFDGSTVIMIVEGKRNAMGIGYNSETADEVYQKLESNGDQFIDELNKKDGSLLFKTYVGNDSVYYSVLNQKADMPAVNTIADILNNPNETLTFPNPIFGSFQEFAVSVENLEEAIAYWEQRGFKSNGISESPYRYTIMYDGLMIIGLHETKGMWYGELLTYSGHGVEENNKVAEDIKKEGFTDIEMLEFGGQKFDGNYILHDPAGNALMMTTDFSKMKK